MAEVGIDHARAVKVRPLSLREWFRRQFLGGIVAEKRRQAEECRRCTVKLQECAARLESLPNADDKP